MNDAQHLSSSAELHKIVVGKMVKSNVPDLQKNYQAKELGSRSVSLPLLLLQTDIIMPVFCKICYNLGTVQYRARPACGVAVLGVN